MRLIDADAFKSYIDCGHLRSPNELCFSELDVVRMLDKQPTVDAEPVRHGEWVQEKHRIFGLPYDYICSVCGCDYALAEYKYCPSCGARMDGGKENA